MTASDGREQGAVPRRILQRSDWCYRPGDVWWADLPKPKGSGPRFRRPIVVVQGDALNRSRIAAVLCVTLTSNLKWATTPGNVLLPSSATGLPKESVANVSQLVTPGKTDLTELISELSRSKLELVLSGIDVVSGRGAVQQPIEPSSPQRRRWKMPPSLARAAPFP